MTTPLADRYIVAVVASLPPRLQSDVRAELEASIEDAVAARCHEGASRSEAEREVLTSFGDPAAFAAGFAGRPLYLIGPKYYLAWWRLLKLLVIVVTLSTWAAVALGQILANAPVGVVIGDSVGTAITAAVHVCFWTTLVFAVLERTGAEVGTAWSLDDLPDASPEGSGRADVIASLLVVGATVGVVLWDLFRGFWRPEGDPVAFLNPGLWPWGIAFVFGLWAVDVVIAVVTYARARWDLAAAIANTVTAVLFAGWVLVVLAGGHLVNPVFIDELTSRSALTTDALRVLGIVLGLAVVGVSAWEALDGWRRYRRSLANRA